jgi:HB1, ASXL, restriction endonuclease HTH domain
MKDRLTRNDLKADLAKAEQELQELLTRAESLREWITATKKLCGKLSHSNEQNQQPITFMSRRRTKTSVLAAQVSEVLLSTGRPMHVDSIAAELAKRGHPVMAKNPAATVAVALGRRTDQFTRVGPNTFDLAKETKEIKVAG